jgi:hypothetical protein
MADELYDPRRCDQTNERGAAYREGIRLPFDPDGDQLRRRHADCQNGRQHSQGAGDRYGQRTHENEKDDRSKEIGGGIEKSVIGQVQTFPGAVFLLAAQEAPDDLPPLIRQGSESPAKQNGQTDR